jgi:hypothetical protein
MSDKTLKILLGIIAVNLTFLTVKDVGLFPTDNAPADDRPPLVHPFAEQSPPWELNWDEENPLAEALELAELRSLEHHRQMITAHFEITDHLNRIQQDIAFFNR